MSQRREPHDSLDFFPTPAWGTRALCNQLEAHVCDLHNMTAWDPACGEGHMVAPLREYFAQVLGSDVHEYFPGKTLLCDFLMFGEPCVDPVDWIITNPPFRLAEQFALKAISRAKVGTALLVRTAFLEAIGRYNNLFSRFPPAYIFQFTERLPMVKGRVDEEAASATAYCWIVWLAQSDGATLFKWIAPCRDIFERDGDYA